MYADADVAFLRDPWPHLTSYERRRGAAAEPSRRRGRAGGHRGVDRRPGNPRPRQRYYGDVGCSGLAYFPLVGPRGARRVLDGGRGGRACGGDQAALETALAFLAYADDDMSFARCRWRFGRTAWRSGLTARAPRPDRPSRSLRKSSPSTRIMLWALHKNARGWSLGLGVLLHVCSDTIRGPSDGRSARWTV